MHSARGREGYCHAGVRIIPVQTGPGYGFAVDRTSVRLPWRSPKGGGQLPPLFKLPEAYLLRQALDPSKKIVVPTWTEWNVHYGVGTDRNHMQGEELMTGVEGEHPVYVPRLQYVPRAWALYFIGRMPSEKAMRLV